MESVLDLLRKNVKQECKKKATPLKRGSLNDCLPYMKKVNEQLYQQQRSCRERQLCQRQEQSCQRQQQLCL